MRPTAATAATATTATDAAAPPTGCVETILNLRVLNLQPIAQQMYPEMAPSAASAKFHNKRNRVRYQKFSPEENQRLQTILFEALRPIALAFAQLSPCPSTPPS
jgi:hypothetical protein